MISCTLVGNLGRDAESRTAGKDAIVEFSVASQNGDKEKTSTWVRCTLWGERGKKLLPWLKKGAKVAVSGTLAAREFTGKDGSKKTSLELRVNELEFAGGKKDSGAEKGDAYEGDDSEIGF